eukprot:sb/3475178/
MQEQHCVLNVGVHAIERLNSCDLFPIVFFVKFKSPHDIKQQFKGNCSIEQAQKVFEKAHKLERGYSDRFTEWPATRKNTVGFTDMRRNLLVFQRWGKRNQTIVSSTRALTNESVTIISSSCTDLHKPSS